MLSLAALLCAGSCSGLSSVRQPEIQVDPAQTLFFPRVVAGTTHRAPLMVRNVGRAPLTIQGVDLDLGEESPFALDDPPTFPLVVEPGGHHVLTVAYSPTVGGADSNDVDSLRLRSDDPAPQRREWVVLLRSANNGPVISVVPSEVDFSLVEGHAGPVTLTVTNSGTEPTTVREVRIEGGPEFALAPVTGLPRELAVGDAFEVQVTCLAADASDVNLTTGITTLLALPEDPAHQAGSATIYGPPVANAGPDRETNPLPQEPTFLNGRSSRSLGNRITLYEWVAVAFPDGSETAVAFNDGVAQEPAYLDAPRCPADQHLSPEPCFIPDVPGTYRFELRVTDVRPLCDLANPAATCDDDAGCCSFSCSGTCQGGAGDGLCREGGGCVIEGVNVDVVEIHALGEGLLVYLTWDGVADLDLHVADDFGGRCVTSGGNCRLDSHCPGADTCNTGSRRWRSVGDCSWENPQPDWGQPRTDNGEPCSTSFDCAPFTGYPDCLGGTGTDLCTDTLDDPRLAKDENTAFGPEIIQLRNPIHSPGPTNVYHIGVHYFPDPVDYAERTATVRVFYEGVELFPASQPSVPLQRALENQPSTVTSLWYAGWIVVTPGDATFIPGAMSTYNVEGTSWPTLVDPP